MNNAITTHPDACMVWEGQIDGKTGHPITSVKRRPVDAGRYAWLEHHIQDFPNIVPPGTDPLALIGQGSLVRRHNLDRVCREKACVWPHHRILAAPDSMRQRMGMTVTRFNQLVHTLMKTARRDDMVWEGDLSKLECHTRAVQWAALRLVIPPELILAAYAVLVRRHASLP